MKWIKYTIAIPFALCVLFLQGLGRCFRLTYKQISVVFNLWIQGGMLVLSASLPLEAYMARIMYDVPHDGGRSTWELIVVFALLGYFLLYLWLYVLTLRHYGGSFDWAFDRCVSDLQKVAHAWCCSYQCVNLIIFVGFFLILIGINLVLTGLVVTMPMSC